MKIKYRIWDNENNRYYEPTYEAYKGNLEDLSVGMGGDLSMRTFEKGTRDVKTIHESMFPNRFVVEMFTGKHCYFNDNEFTELYEGDIVETVYGKMECVWNDDLCCFQIEGNDKCFNFHQIDISGQPIIGNIHEPKQ